MRTKQVERCLNFCCETGRQLIKNGAEIYRVEEAAKRMLAAYGYTDAEVFAIPSCIIINIHDGEHNYTKNVRILHAGSNFDRLASLNALSRKVAAKALSLNEAEEALREIMGRKGYAPFISYFGYGFAAFFFTLFWGGCTLDAAIAFFCGLLVKAAVGQMVKLKANVFFINVAASMLLVTVPVLLTALGVTLIHTDKIVIGTIMLLVPGIAITNVMRDVIIGDFITAVSKLAEVLIIALAIAIGIAIPFGLLNVLTGGM